MHELSVCLALVEELKTLAKRRDARIRSVSITIGPLSGVEPHLIAQAFPLACASTLAEGSKLCISVSPVRIRCRVCATESIVAVNRLTCRVCGDWQTELLSGDELMLNRVEIDVPEATGEPIAAAEIAGDCHV